MFGKVSIDTAAEIDPLVSILTVPICVAPLAPRNSDGFETAGVSFLYPWNLLVWLWYVFYYIFLKYIFKFLPKFIYVLVLICIALCCSLCLHHGNSLWRWIWDSQGTLINFVYWSTIYKIRVSFFFFAFRSSLKHYIFFIFLRELFAVWTHSVPEKHWFIFNFRNNFLASLFGQGDETSGMLASLHRTVELCLTIIWRPHIKLFSTRKYYWCKKRESRSGILRREIECAVHGYYT